jgi:hypothetical protein
MGLRGRRAASTVPTVAAGTTAAAMVSQSATGPPVPAWCESVSSGALARSIPSVTKPSAIAPACAARLGLTIVLNALSPRPIGRAIRTEPTAGTKRSENVTVSCPEPRGTSWPRP